MRALFTWLLGIAVAMAASAAVAQDTWMSVVLDGRKIGHLHRTEAPVNGGGLRTTSTLVIDLTRTDSTVRISNTSASTEDAQGRPLEFSSRTRMSSMDTEVHGKRRADGRFAVTSQVGGLEHERMVAWPKGALMPAGQRRIMREHGLKPGTRYRMINFDPTTQSGIRVDMLVMGPGRVSLPEGTRTLHHIRQSLHIGDSIRVMDLWVDEDFHIMKGLTNLLGFSLEMLACSRDCAMQPSQSIDLLSSTMVDSPRPLTAALRSQPIRYLIKVPKDDHIRLITTSEQHALRIMPGLWQVDVGFARSRKLPGPTPDDTAPTYWLQADAPVIIDLAKRAVGDARSDRARVQRMTEFVRHYIDNQGLSVGYASALEAARDKTGDCTEHAVLLAAMIRAQGIPARVVTGLAFADRYSGHTNVFVPHAWVQAWIRDHWQSYDPTLGRFDSTHIALAIGDGDPWRYFANMDVLGKMHITRASLISELINPPAPPPQGRGAVGGAGGAVH